jgi:hypothetical protein
MAVAAPFSARARGGRFFQRPTRARPRRSASGAGDTPTLSRHAVLVRWCCRHVAATCSMSAASVAGFVSSAVGCAGRVLPMAAASLAALSSWRRRHWRRKLRRPRGLLISARLESVARIIAQVNQSRITPIMSRNLE